MDSNLNWKEQFAYAHAKASGVVSALWKSPLLRRSNENDEKTIYLSSYPKDDLQVGHMVYAPAHSAGGEKRDEVQ